MSKKKQSKKPQREPSKAPSDQDKCAEAEKEATSPEQKCDDLLARLQRVTADYLNYQKRVQRDIAQTKQFANDDLIRALLEVLDDMERGLDAGKVNHKPEDPLLQGMMMVYQKAVEILARFGLEEINAQGKPFDPDQHAAMMQEPSEQHPPQTVLRELQKGYKLKGRTIRPSTVVVSQAPEAPGEPQGENDKPEERDSHAHI